MFKDNLKSIYCIMKYNYKKLFNTPRIYILIILQSIYLWYLISPIVDLSKTAGVRLTPWLFSHISSYKISQLFLMMGIIVMFADAPFIDDEYKYILIRSGRKKWALGQILYIVTGTIAYFITIFIFTVIMIIPNIFISSDWGRLITTFANSDTRDYFELLISFKILVKYTPIMATLLSILLSCLTGVIISLIMFIINIKLEKSIGIIVATFIVFLDRAIFSNFPNFKFAYISPVSLSRIDGLDKVSNGMSPSILYALAFGIVSISILSIISVKVAKKAIN